MTDEQKRIALVTLLEPYLVENQFYYEPTPLVPLELFFDGNEDTGSIGCNLVPHPGVAEFRRTLLELRDDPAVSGLWMIAIQHDWKPGWPHSDKILVRTSLDEDEIAARLDHLRPDTADKVTLNDFRNDVTGASATCPSDEHYVIAWWD